MDTEKIVTIIMMLVSTYLGIDNANLSRENGHKDEQLTTVVKEYHHYYEEKCGVK